MICFFVSHVFNIKDAVFKAWKDENDLILFFLRHVFGVDVFSLLVGRFFLSVVYLLHLFNSYLVIIFELGQVLLIHP